MIRRSLSNYQGLKLFNILSPAGKICLREDDILLFLVVFSRLFGKSRGHLIILLYICVSFSILNI